MVPWLLMKVEIPAEVVSDWLLLTATGISVWAPRPRVLRRHVLPFLKKTHTSPQVFVTSHPFFGGVREGFNVFYCF